MASSGLVADSTAVPQATYQPTTQGGVRLGGSTSSLKTFDHTALGGAVSSGLVVVGIMEPTSGGMMAGSSAVNSVRSRETMSGGATLSGLAAVAFFDLVGTSGGLRASGTAHCTTITSKICSGGAVLGASSHVTSNQKKPVSGGAVVGTTALVSSNQPEPVSGGAMLGGAGLVALVNVVRATGGLVGGSSASVSTNVTNEIQGGATLGGAGINTAYVGLSAELPLDCEITAQWYEFIIPAMRRYLSDLGVPIVPLAADQGETPAIVYTVLSTERTLELSGQAPDATITIQLNVLTDNPGDKFNLVNLLKAKLHQKRTTWNTKRINYSRITQEEDFPFDHENGLFHRMLQVEANYVEKVPSLFLNFGTTTQELEQSLLEYLADLAPIYYGQILQGVTTGIAYLMSDAEQETDLEGSTPYEEKDIELVIVAPSKGATDRMAETVRQRLSGLLGMIDGTCTLNCSVTDQNDSEQIRNGLWATGMTTKIHYRRS